MAAAGAVAETGGGQGGARSYAAVLWHSEEHEEKKDEDEQIEKEKEGKQSHPRSVDRARRPLDRPPKVYSSL